MNYQEHRQSQNHKLTDRIQQELTVFHEELLAKTPQEIYDAAHQIALKSDIAECLSSADFSPYAAKALMKSPNLLDDQIFCKLWQWAKRRHPKTEIEKFFH